MRICVIGDELVAGVGDPRGLGWVGRVIGRSSFPEPPVVLSLAMPGETTGELSSRWEREVAPRTRPGDTRLVVGIGAADVPAGLSTPRTRLNLANIIDRAATLKLPCLVVGPPPLAGADRRALEAVSRACAEVCERRHVPFVDTLRPLASHDQWTEDMAASPARTEHGIALPGQAGYALMAWLVLHEGWDEWSGAEPRA
jgi:lysophospholipase L1-like esterase